MALTKEKSCGCIIVNNNRVLLVYEKNRNFWGFPKGHVEENESEKETAIRECKEEVGLDVVINSNKKYSTKYIIDNKIEKVVVLFGATSNSDNVVMQTEEIKKYKWCRFDEAYDLLSFDNLKQLFKKFMEDYNV